jgi:rifampicin phosphotransferase
MARPLILSLSHCSDVSLTGGKAAGLARLLAAGFPVPPGICLTTEAYRRYVEGQALAEPGFWSRVIGLSEAERRALLADSRRRIKGLKLTELARQWEAELGSLNIPPDTIWAVRSSATNEDLGTASFAGLYRITLRRSSRIFGPRCGTKRPCNTCCNVLQPLLLLPWRW